jgi:hypothetical protein
MFVVGLLLCAAGVLSGSAQRTTVSLDFGWRVQTAPLPECAYPVHIPGIIQTGGWLVKNVISSAGCAAAACAANAQAWSFCAGGCGEQSLDPWYFWPLQTVLPPPKCVLGNTGQLRSTNSTSLQNWTTKARGRGGPPIDTPEAKAGYDDSAWKVVDLPHDASIEHGYTLGAAHGEAFVTDAQTFYRKHITLATAFKGRAITLEVDGALMYSSWWVNDVRVVTLKTDGYLPLTLRLDTLADVQLKYGTGAVNTIVAWTDNSATTGWWYEGSGLARHARLVVSPAAAQLRPFAIAAPVVVGAPVNARDHPAQGLTAAVVVSPSADISVAPPRVELSLTFELVGNDGVVAGHTTIKRVVSGGTTIAAPPMHLEGAELWSVARPFLYTLVTTLAIGSSGEVDTVNTTVGIRGIEWDPGDGLHLNGQVTKMRGFCNHESFTGIGAAIPPRIDLFRIQQMRGVGGNAWRTSHNPPEPALLDVADRLGVLVLDENRVFATTTNCPADYNHRNRTCAHGYLPDDPGDIADEVGKLALRDRNHASVIWYSLCNEAGCGPGTLLKDDTAQKCQKAIHALDRDRVITGNLYGMQGEAVAPGTPISSMLDVMGMSHQTGATFDAWHTAEPEKLVVATECCSCETQRGEDADLMPFRSSTASPFVYNSNENSACVMNRTQTSNGVEWIGGTFVWTLHDYLGEPSQNVRGAYWPHVSSSFGSFDLSGFPKAPVWWYRSWWLAAIKPADAGRPPLPVATTSYFCRLVESWQPSPSGISRNLTVYTNAPSARILVNGEVVGAIATVAPFTAARLFGVAFSPGNVTAECLSPHSVVLASHTKHSWGNATAIELTLDAPSIRTGTGSSVYMDGQDVALVRATVVDAHGVPVHDSIANITFRVSNGPARLIGVGNGDPANRDPNHVQWKPAYHGLARAIFRVTIVAAGTASERAMTKATNIDAGAGPWSSSVHQGDIATISDFSSSFTVSAIAEGLPGGWVHLNVPLSVQPRDAPLNVAAANVALADIGE